MKKFLSVIVAVAAVIVILGAAKVVTAQWQGPHGPGMGRMGHGMMGGAGFGANQTQITDQQARDLAQQYADKNLAGFKVERVLPSTGMPHTMYVVELKNDKGDLRTIHVNPFGGVMPFGAPRGT
jgi:hypothetical protein